MTNPQDSDLGQGAGGVPTPTVSGSPDAQPSSQGVNAEDALVEKAISRLMPQVERLVQSTKDKRFKDVEEVKQYVPTMQQMKAYLDANGGDVHKAAREMAIDNLLSGKDTGTAPTQEAPTQLTPFQKATADLPAQEGIAPNDPEVAEMAKKSYASEADWFEDLLNLSNRRSNGTAAPSAPINDARGRPSLPEDEAKKLDKIPFSQSRDFYALARKQMQKGQR